MCKLQGIEAEEPIDALLNSSQARINGVKGLEPAIIKANGLT
jgi:hypothetical protein